MDDSVALDALLLGMTPPSRKGIIGFGKEHVKFPHSDRAPTFDPDVAPWLVEPLEALANNSNTSVICRASVGSSKTTMFEVAIPYCIAEDPGSMTVITQTDEDTFDWVDTRLNGVLQACAPVAALWPTDRGKIKKGLYNLPNMFIAFGGANLSNLQSKSIRWCLGDEVWRWRKGMVPELKGRMHDRWNARLFLVSQGGEEGDDFSLEFAETDQRVRHWKCEKCKCFNPYRFEDLKWKEYWVDDEEGGIMDYNAISESVHLECPSCHERYSDNPVVRRSLSAQAKYISSNPNALPGAVGFWWNAMSVYWIAWRKLVIEYLKAIKLKKQGDDSKFWAWKQKRFAEDKRLEDSIDRISLSGADYEVKSWVPLAQIDGEAYRFLTGDKQLDHYWIVIRAFRFDGSSRLLYEGKVWTEGAIREKQLAYGIKDKLVGIDAQYDTPKIYRMCAKYGWTAMHGSREAGFKHYSSDKRKKPVTKFVSKVEEASLGGGKKASYIFWSNEKIKDILTALRTGQGVPWEVPRDISPVYLKQIDSEVKKDFVNPTTKQIEKRYVRVYKHNHLWDCECEQIVFAYSIGLLGDYMVTENPDSEGEEDVTGEDDD